ncbi:MAG: hypothetical protein KF724_04850 [Phycisphaeraceae bacterium]|nr:hypothetical protein [Phycisphaeraceae bacterium]
MPAISEALRERLRTITELGDAPEDRIPTGWPTIDRMLGGGLARRGIHEWCSVGDRASLRLPPMGVLIEVAWRALDHDRDRRGAMGHVVWIGRACHPHPVSLRRGGQALVAGRVEPVDAALLERSLMIDAGSRQERAWAIEQAARCPGVSVVVGDGAGFDMALSRRVQLAATHSALVLLVRLEEERAAPSIALTRWLVEPSEALAPPGWRTRLLRSKQGGATVPLAETPGEHARCEEGA